MEKKMTPKLMKFSLIMGFTIIFYSYYYKVMATFINQIKKLLTLV